MPRGLTDSAEELHMTVEVQHARNKALISVIGPDNTADYALDGDVILIGEAHSRQNGAQNSRSMFRELGPLLTNIDAVCVEMPPARTSGTSGAMGIADTIAEGKGADLINIDEPRAALNTAIAEHERNYDRGVNRVTQDANTFTETVDEDGDLPETVAENARQLVYELHGEDVFHEMYTVREIGMASRLRWLTEQYDGAVIAVVGAFHVKALKEQLENGFAKFPVDDERFRERRVLDA